MSSPAAADDRPPGSLEIRPPLQRRSREAWDRVLDAGVELLEEGGYEAFTIAAVCDRGHVAPRAIYDRADSKDALFLAVYEHGMARVRAEESVFADDQRWHGFSTQQLVRTAVGEVAGIFARHSAFLRSVVLISGLHPEIYRRGSIYSQELGEAFAHRLLVACDEIDQPDPEKAVLIVFNTVFSTLVLRTAYGASFATAETDDDAMLDALSSMVDRYLFAH